MVTMTRYKGFRIFGDQMLTYQILALDDEVIDEVSSLEDAVKVIDDFLSPKR